MNRYYLSSSLVYHPLAVLYQHEHKVFMSKAVYSLFTLDKRGFQEAVASAELLQGRILGPLRYCDLFKAESWPKDCSVPSNLAIMYHNCQVRDIQSYLVSEFFNEYEQQRFKNKCDKHVLGLIADYFMALSPEEDKKCELRFPNFVTVSKLVRDSESSVSKLGRDSESSVSKLGRDSESSVSTACDCLETESLWLPYGRPSPPTPPAVRALMARFYSDSTVELNIDIK